MNKDVADKILAQTEAGYDLIAGKFSQTRKHFWRGLEFIRDFVQDGDKVLDFGCGNGRLLELLSDKKIAYSGVDVSQKLIDIAKVKYVNPGIIFQKISGQGTLAFPNNNFNTIYSIAVFHHLPGKVLRLQNAKELFRVLRPGGKVVITVWKLWQRRYIRHIFRNWLDRLAGKSKLDWNDCHISFTGNQAQKFDRYHHAFTKGELRRLFQAAGFEVEICGAVGGRNLVLIGQKLPNRGYVLK